MQQFFTTLIGFFRKSIEALINYWKKITWIQRLMALGISGALVAIVVVIGVLSSRPDKVYLFTNQIQDEQLLVKISSTLDAENIPYNIDTNNRISVSNRNIALYARNILIREDLLPSDTDPWELFDIQRWTQTDFERNVNLQRAITRTLEQHIESLDDIDNAKVTLVLPGDTLFVEDRNPVTASIILILKPGSDFRENRKKIEGVERLILLSVEGLLVENITISDSTGVQINNFADFEDFDSLELTRREIQIKQEYENQYKQQIFGALQDIYSPDRVRIVNIDVEIDFSKKLQETTENFPIVVTADNPKTPYNETEVVLSIPRSQEDITESYKGTGFNPEGPPGVEGQTPPSYKDLDGIVGSWDHSTSKINNEINQRVTTEETRPTVKRMTASIAIDGVWKRKYDEKGQLIILPSGEIDREYIPLESSELQQAIALVESAIGFSIQREDIVSVENIQFDRTAEFAAENLILQRRALVRRILFYGVLAIIAALILLALFRFIVRRIEKYRLQKEERLAEQYRKMREEQIRSMSEDTLGEETEVQSLTRNLTQVVYEKPEEVSTLIRSWALEG